MRRWTLATAMTLMLTAAACGGSDGEDVDAGSDDPAQTDEVLVPVERSTDLLDPEGSQLGTASLRDADSGATQLEVQVAGLTQGFHGMYLFETDSCDAVDGESAAVLLSPMLVLESGIGSITTLVGPIDLEELFEGEGPTVVIADAVATPDGVDAAGPGSRVACGTFSG